MLDRYFLRTCELEQVVEMIKEAGAEFSANWPHYHHVSLSPTSALEASCISPHTPQNTPTQVLSEANFLLRAKVGALSGLTLKRDSALMREK